ncbi:MAG TPA: flavin reductase family protein [Caulobacteraceae bacterium]
MAQASSAPAITDRPLSGASSVLDETLFRDAMARLAGGVAIAACWDGEIPRGLLVSSITALSTEPPRVLFCVRKAAASHGALLRAYQCSVAILADEDLQEAERFSDAGRTPERFDPAVWSLSPHSSPQHRAPLIALTGQIGSRIDAGTHTIFILNVRAVTTKPGAPLVYFDRAFCGLAASLPADG